MRPVPSGNGMFVMEMLWRSAQRSLVLLLIYGNVPANFNTNRSVRLWCVSRFIESF